MPTTKDRTPAAWRSQVPTDVRSLACEAADLKGDRSQSGPRAKPADRTGKGPIFLGSEALQTRPARDD